MHIKFFVKGIPRPKGSGHSIKVRGKSVYIGASKYQRSWARSITIKAKATNGLEIVQRERPVGIALRFVFEKAKGSRFEKYPLKPPDLDKLARSVLDALTGVAFVDDCQVMHIELSKKYGKTAGVSIEVWDNFWEGPKGDENGEK